MWLLLDTQCNGAAAAASGDAGVFTSNATSTTMVNLANSGRFRILKKWEWNFNPPAGATTGFNTVNRSFSFFKKCDIPLEFDASADTGALTTIRSNNLFLVAGATAAIDDLVSVAGTCRLRFSDN